MELVERPNLNPLPAETLAHVYSYLDYLDLCTVAQCSRDCRAVAKMRGLQASVIVATVLRQENVPFDWSQLNVAVLAHENCRGIDQSLVAQREHALVRAQTRGSIRWEQKWTNRIGTVWLVSWVASLLYPIISAARYGYEEKIERPWLLEVFGLLGVPISAIGPLFVSAYYRYKAANSWLDIVPIPTRKQENQGSRFCLKVQEKALGHAYHPTSQLAQHLKNGYLSTEGYTLLSMIASDQLGQVGRGKLVTAFQRIVWLDCSRAYKESGKGMISHVHPLYGKVEQADPASSSSSHHKVD